MMLTVAGAYILGAAPMARAIQCGDVDGNGSIAATDALTVLKKGVGLETPPLLCPAACSTTTSTVVANDCFSDFD